MKQFSVLVQFSGGTWWASAGAIKGQAAPNPAAALEMLAQAFRRAGEEFITTAILEAQR